MNQGQGRLAWLFNSSIGAYSPPWDPTSAPQPELTHSCPSGWTNSNLKDPLATRAGGGCVCDRKLPQSVNDKNVMMSEKQTSSAEYQLQPVSCGDAHAQTSVQRSVDGGGKGQQCLGCWLQEAEVERWVWGGNGSEPSTSANSRADPLKPSVPLLELQSHCSQV